MAVRSGGIDDVRVLVCNADEGGTGFYRLLAACDVLKGQGCDITLDLMMQDHTSRFSSMNGGPVQLGEMPYDVVVLQRPMTYTAPDAIRLMQAQGIAVVVELDDDYWNIDPRNYSYKEFHPKHNPAANHEFLRQACRAADLVMVSTPALAAAVPNENVALLRNCVPARYLSFAPDQGDNWNLVENRKTVGWTGDPIWHIGDLEVVGDGVRRAVRKCGAVFIGLGSEKSGPMLGFDGGESLFSGWIELENYPKAIKNLDVGLVPLRMSPFNQAKSYLKGIEYASLGVPFVASPTDEYVYLARRSVGVLAPQKHDWAKEISRLLTDEKWAQEVTARGLAFATEHTYESQAWRWWEAWARAVAIRKAK